MSLLFLLIIQLRSVSHFGPVLIFRYRPVGLRSQNNWLNFTEKKGGIENWLVGRRFCKSVPVMILITCTPLHPPNRKIMIISSISGFM